MHPWFERLRHYAVLMRWHRPIGTLLLLWPMLWALWIAAGGWPDTDILVIFLLGTFIMRSAGCIINDFADRDFDGHVTRTQERPLASGQVSPREALILFVILLMIAAQLVLLTNTLTILLSLAGVALAVSYPFMKRYTYLPQVHLGAAFGWAVPMAYAAQTGTTPPLAWLIFIAAVLWAIVYDTQYAMVDRDDDIRIGVKSTAILFGDNDRVMIGVFQLLLLADLIIIGIQAALRWPYYLALVLAAGFGLYQQYLIRDRDPPRCFAAFMNNNWFGFVVFVGVAASYLLAT